MIAVFGLYYGQAYLVYMDDDKKSNSFLDYITMILRSVGIIVVNAIINILLDLCLKFENVILTVQLSFSLFGEGTCLNYSHRE